MARTTSDNSDGGGFSLPAMIGIVSVITLGVVALMVTISEGGLGSNPTAGFDEAVSGVPAEGVADTASGDLVTDPDTNDVLESAAGATIGADVQGTNVPVQEAPEQGVTDTEPMSAEPTE